MSKSPFLIELRFLVVASLIMSGFSYITNLFLAYSMGPEIFGQYTYALVLGALFGQVVYFGSAETGINLVTNYGEDALNWILTARIINFLLVSIGTLFVFLINSDTVTLFALVVTLSSLSFATQYEAKGRNVRYASVYLVERILIAIFIWIGLLKFDSHLLLWVFGTILVFQGASLVFQYTEHMATRITLNRKGLFNVYKEGFLVFVFALSKFAFGGVTRILIINQLGAERMGIFAAAWQFVPVSTLYFAQTTKTWRLQITRSLKEGDTDKFLENLKAVTLFVMVPSFFSAVVFWVFGREIIDFLLPSEYHDAGFLMPYIGVYFLVVGFDSVIVLLAIANSMVRLASIIYVAFSGLTIFACLLLSTDAGLERYLLIIVFGHFFAAAVVGGALFRSVRAALP